MKQIIFYLMLFPVLLASCDSHEVQKSHLLEYWLNGVYTSTPAEAIKYTEWKNGVKKANLWNIYETGSTGISITVPDSTFTKNTYDYPSFSAVLKTSSGTYRASSGQFRLLGIQISDLTGDFHFKMKNITNPDDSLMVTEGYFVIYLDYRDSTLLK